MRTALIFVAVAVLVLTLLYLLTDVWFRPSSIDIHVHDTYFVINRPHVLLLLLLYLGTFFLLGGTIGTKLKNKVFLILFLVFLAADVYLFWNVYSAFHR